MIPYDIDPSLYTQSQEPKLDDGFSPPDAAPPQAVPGEEPSTVATVPPVEPVLSDKSDF